MTQREFLKSVIETVGTEDESVKPIVEYAEAALAKLDAANEKKRNTPSKAQKENAPLIEKLNTILSDKPMTASDVAVALEVSVQKASALLRSLAVKDLIDQGEEKVAKKGTVKVYSLKHTDI